MDLKLGGFNLVSNQQKVDNFKNQNQKINFAGKPDIIDFSAATKERTEIIKQLVEIGYSKEAALEVISQYYKTDEYFKLVSGIHDEFGDLAGHNIDISRNLTPAEAIVYLDFQMDDYYVANFGGSKEDGELIGGKALPLDVAKYMLNNYDAPMAALIAVGVFDEETAKQISQYYELDCVDNFNRNEDGKVAEKSALKIKEKLDKLNLLTSDKKDENGNYQNGLTRPLTKEEAVWFVAEIDLIQTDIDSFNKYIYLNDNLGISMYDIKQSQIENFEQLVKKYNADKDEPEVPKIDVIRFPKQKITFENQEDRMEFLISKELSRYSNNPDMLERYIPIYEELAKLDNDKFFKRLTLKGLVSDVKFVGITIPQERIIKNIQTLNGISDELLEKIAPTKKDGKKSLLIGMSALMSARNLEERMSNLEEFRQKSPEFFAIWTKEDVLDYLTGSNLFSESKEMLDLFNFSIEKGYLPSEEPIQKPQIIEFSKKEDE